MASQDQHRQANGVSPSPSVVFFGAQVTQWTTETLSRLQQNLQQNQRLRFLADALAGVFQLQPSLSKLLGSEAPTLDSLQTLASLSTSAALPDISTFTAVHLSPLTVACHVVDFVRLAEEHGHGAKPHDELPSEMAAQGFCIGFLSAAAVASSATWAEFEGAARRALHLAVCIGAIVDAAEQRAGKGQGHAAHSVRWKTEADRASMEALVDALPGAYISCLTDERTATVTLATADHDTFYTRIEQDAGLVAKPIDLYGCFHHDQHTAAARALKDLCAADAQLQLPAAERLRFPLRSTVNGEPLTSGTLHDAAIDAILTRRAHWFQTVRNTLRDLPADAEIKSIPLDAPSLVPRTLQQQHAAAKTNSTLRATEEVAIVGMACRFPRADSVHEFWELLRAGGTALSQVPAARFDRAQVGREPQLANYWGNFLEKPDAFDHRFFGISGREAKSMDPQQRLALQVAYEALESAGYFSGLLTPEEKRVADVGCYLGVGSVDYEDNVASEKANAFAATGTLRAFISGRISHHFGWSGPSITFDTACSSSAVAIHSACQAILAGECSMAVAGGVNVITSPTLYQNLAAASFLSPTGSSKAFDASADGYCRGEGCGILVLKPLSRAVAEGDDVLAVISGTAVNQGANCSPITVPHSESQKALYTKALALGGIDPAEVTYVEAHGTGTPVGDPIEFESVRSTFSLPTRKEDLFLGSVKDNIGHAEGASGAAGVIKTVLMMQQGTIPRQANFRTLNPRIAATPADRITVPTATQPWEVAGRRVALVNNYGAAGSNAAIVLRERPAQSPATASSATITKQRSCYPVLLAAKSPGSLRAYAAALRTRIASASKGIDVGDVAYGVAKTHNAALEYRAAVKADTIDELLGRLDEVAAAEDASPRLVQVPAQRRPVVLCFGGQTGRVVVLSKALFDSCAVLRAYLNKCDDACKALGLPSLFPTIFQGEPVEDLVALHCMLFSLQYSTAKCWLDSNLEVDTLVGHSFGQLTALCVAESVSLKDALRLIAGRARLIQELWGPEPGTMLAVEGEMQEIQAVVETVNQEEGVKTDFACYNGPGSVVIAGDARSVDRLETLFRRPDQPKRFKTARLENSHAYHSRFADAILPGLEQLAESITFKAPRIRVETCSPGESWASVSAREVAQHTRQPVYFHDAVQRISARLPAAVWVEAGSSSAIIPMARRILPGRADAVNHVFIPLDLGGNDATSVVAAAASQLWLAGSKAQPWHFVGPQRGSYSRFDLPPYQFEQPSHWIRTIASGRSYSPAETDKDPKPSSLVRMVKGGSSSEALFLVDTTHPMFDLATRGHAVVGQSLCPASMYIELAARSASLMVPNGSDVVPHVEDLIMSSPLGLTADADVYVRLSRQTGTSLDFSVFSQPRGNGESEVQHGRGRIRLGAADDPVAAGRIALLKRVARGVPSERITNAAGATSISGALVYKIFGDVVEYAPYYRGVRSLVGSEHEAVGSVMLSTDRPHGLESGVCDPLLLDNFLQVAGIHVNCLTERNPAEVFMCTAVEEVVFSAPFLQARGAARSWSVYSRYETVGKSEVINDIFVFDASSMQLVLAIMGAAFKSVPFKSLARSLARLNGALPAPGRDSGYASPNIPLGGKMKPDSQISTASSTFPIAVAPQQTTGAATPSREPSTHSRVDDKIRTMFSEIIEMPVAQVLPSSTFDDLGVDSLLVTEVLSEIQKRFGVQMTPGEFQECHDVLGLCRRIAPGSADASPEAAAAPLQEVETSGSKLPSNSSNGSLNGVAHTNGDRDAGESNGVGPNLALASQESFEGVKTGYDAHAQTTRFAGFCDDAYTLQSKLVAQYVVEAFSSLGCDLSALSAGDQVPTIRHIPQHNKLIPQLYKILEDAGLVARDTANTTVYRRTEAALPSSTTTASQLHAAMLARYPQHEAETKLLHTTAPRLADCLIGTADPLALIFRDANARKLLEEVYTHAPMFKAGTMLLADYLCSVVDAVGPAREVRILELGAGTGGTTKHLVERLAAAGGNRRRFTYTFTDLSSSLVAAAKRKFAGLACMRYAVMDIEKEPAAAELGAYDIVLSTNCIHATRDLVKSTTHIRRMLRPDGVLCLVELTRNLFWFDLVFGLLEGWWLFEDGREHALADEGRWQKCLRAAGFQWVDWSDGPSRESDVLRVITASSIPAASGPNGGSDWLKVEEPAAVNGRHGKVEQNGTSPPSKETVVFKQITADGLQLEADIYYPAQAVDPAKPLPVALMIHGGGHIMLSRDDIRPQQTELLLRNGFLPVSIDYRLCPETTLSDGPLTDVADALAWARNKLPGLKLQRRDVRADGNRVVAVGWSTGGMLALSLAWKPSAEQRGVRPVDGVLAFYCPTDYEDEFWTRPNRPGGSEAAAARYGDYQLDDATWTAGVFDRPVTRYNVPAAADQQGRGRRGAQPLGGWLAPSDARSRLALYMNWHGQSLSVLLRGLDKSKRVEPAKPTADMVRAVSPLAHAQAGEHASPTFVVHPRADDLIPWQQAVRTHDAIHASGVRAELRLVGGNAPHLFDVYRGWEANEEARVAVEDGYAFLCECVGLVQREKL